MDIKKSNPKDNPIKITCKASDVLPIDSILEFQGNLKKISNDNRNKLMSSILSEGFMAPIFLWDDSGDYKILDGHQRLKTLLYMREKGWDIPLLPVVHIEADNQSDARRKLLKITSQYGEFDPEELNGWIDWVGNDIEEEIRLVNDEIELELNEDIEETIGDDEINDKVDSITKLGDLWELGDHRLLCGDSTKSENIEKLMNGEEWDVCIFDPPYELEELYNEIPTFKSEKKLVVFWDFKRFALAPSSAINKGWTGLYEFIWDNVTSWYTPNRPLARHKSCGIFGEDPFFNFDKAIIKDGKKRTAKIVHNTRGSSDYKPLDGAKHISTVEQFLNTKIEGNHKHAKPIGWIEAIYRGVGGISYLDLFGGSGSTLIVCEKMGIKSFTMELDPLNCDIIIDRYKNWCDKNNLEIKIYKC